MLRSAYGPNEPDDHPSGSPLQTYSYAPIVAPRLSANDYSTYLAPLPGRPNTNVNPYLTFAWGNRLPPPAPTPPPHSYYLLVSAQDQAQFQMGRNATFGPNLSQPATASLLQRMRDLWFNVSNNG